MILIERHEEKIVISGRIFHGIFLHLEDWNVKVIPGDERWFQKNNKVLKCQNKSEFVAVTRNSYFSYFHCEKEEPWAKKMPNLKDSLIIKNEVSLKNSIMCRSGSIRCKHNI